MSERNRSEIKSSYGTIKYFRQTILHWTYQNPHRYPWRSSRIRFHALIVEILLQRTRAEQVIPIYGKFVNAYPSPDRLSASPLSRIKAIIAPLGLQWRARKMKELACVLADHYGGKIPMRLDALIALPGVGPYAASAYLSLHHNKRALLIDSNIVRLYGRFFGFRTHAETRRNRALMKLIDLLTPQDGCRRFNYAVLDLGRDICRPKPLCTICPVSIKCYYYKRRKEQK